MRKSLCASILVLTLCNSAFAGDITNPPAPATCYTDCPSLAAGAINNPPGEIQSSDAQSADGLAEAALDILDTVLALF